MQTRSLKNLPKHQKTVITRGNLLDYLYHQSYYKPIATDLLRQTITSNSQQVKFTGTLEQHHDVITLVIT